MVPCDVHSRHPDATYSVSPLNGAWLQLSSTILEECKPASLYASGKAECALSGGRNTGLPCNVEQVKGMTQLLVSVYTCQATLIGRLTKHKI